MPLCVTSPTTHTFLENGLVSVSTRCKRKTITLHLQNSLEECISDTVTENRRYGSRWLCADNNDNGLGVVYMNYNITRKTEKRRYMQTVDVFSEYSQFDVSRHLSCDDCLKDRLRLIFIHVYFLVVIFV